MTALDRRPRRGAFGCLLLAVLLLALILTLAPNADAAGAGKRLAKPDLDAKAWQLIDARTGKALAGHNENLRLPMASTTKMMTAYLTLNSLPMTKTVKVGEYVPGDPSESLMGLEAGQKITVRDLLYGLVMKSGNDAAHALAVAVSGSQRKFVVRMNAAARRLGLSHTHYTNPIGLDARGHFTSARDLASLGRTLMSIPKFRPIASARTAVLESYDPPLRIDTTDSFLAENPWARGIKTGHTIKAGYVLASDGRRRATELIAAVIDAPTEAARNAESVKLLDYGFSRYRKRVPLRRGRVFTSLPIRFEDGRLRLVASRTVRIGVRNDEKLSLDSKLPDQVEGPFRKGRRIGTTTVRVNGKVIASVPLRAAFAVEKPALSDRALELLEGWWPLLVILGLVILVIGYYLVRLRRKADLQRRLKRVARKGR